MLALAREAATARGVAARMTFQHAAADRLTHLYDPASFDVVVCHNVLEYLSDPPRAVRDIARLLRPGGLCSLLVRNRAGEVLKAALVSRDWTRAAATLSLDSVREGLYGGTVRIFAPSDLHGAIGAASLEVVEQRGVRVIADYIEPERLEEADAARVFELESTLGARPEFVAVARYLHLIARRPVDATGTPR